MITASIIPIGNSRGVRIPKPLLEACGLIKDVFISIQENALVIRPAQKVSREGWAKDAQSLSKEEKKEVFSGNNNFDLSDWQWQ